MGGLRYRLAQRRIQVLVVLVVVAFAAALILLRLPRPIAGVGMLDQCLWGWPVVVFEGEDSTSVVPDNLRPLAQRQVPIAEWPSGMRYDEAAGALLDGRGEPVFRNGDRVRVKGSVIEVEGDPSPCFYTLGVKVEEIAKP